MIGTAAATTNTFPSSSPLERGVVSLAVEDLLHRVTELEATRRFRLRASCLEVYNETCNDLLSPERTNLKLFEKADGVLVPGLSEWDVASTADMDGLLRAAEQQRHTGSTASNDRSSRSHLLCTLTVDSWAREDAEDVAGAGGVLLRTTNAAVLSSTLQLVDLAGSERRQATASEAQSHEGGAINKSLLTLSTIIHRLSERPPPDTILANSPERAVELGEPATSAPQAHLPFRDSKLTRLLQPCLGGPAHAIVLATIRQSAACIDESLSTLRFAVKARRVLNTPGVADYADASSSLFDRLSAEILSLRKQLDATQPGPSRPPSLPGSKINSPHPNRGAPTPISRGSPIRGVRLRGAENATVGAGAGAGAICTTASASYRRPGTAAASLAFTDATNAPFATTATAGVSSDRKVDEPRTVTEYTAVLERFGVALPGAVRSGMSLKGLHALEQAARTRQSIEGWAAQLRAVVAERSSRYDLDAERPGYDGAIERPLPRVVAAADAAVVDALEAQLVDVVTGCHDIVALLLGDLQEAHKMARSSKGMLHRDKPGAQVIRASILNDERSRAVRRSKAGLCGQHDMLSHLIASRAGHRELNGQHDA